MNFTLQDEIIFLVGDLFGCYKNRLEDILSRPNILHVSFSWRGLLLEKLLDRHTIFLDWRERPFPGMDLIGLNHKLRKL